MDRTILALEIALAGCILVIIGFVGLFTRPYNEPKGMTLTECLEAVGDYTLCERKLTNGK